MENSLSPKSSIRLNKYISESEICSRREADRYIEQGHVFINKVRAVVGDKVYAGDRVVVNGIVIEPREAEDLIIIAYNKPIGIVCTTENVKDNILREIKHSNRIFPIGRLDKDSQGLILLTNDGDIVNKILRAGNMHKKEYIVTVGKPITDNFIEEMSNGVPILGETTKKCLVIKESQYVFKIVLIQGLNRQIRRMCDYFDYPVTKIERTRVMNITLKGISQGDWRELNSDELAELMKMIEHSSSTQSNSNKKKKRKPRASSTDVNGKPHQSYWQQIRQREKASRNKKKY